MPNRLLIQWGALYKPSKVAQVRFPVSFSNVFSVYTGFGNPSTDNWTPQNYPTVANILTKNSVYIANNDGTRVNYYWLAIGLS